MYRKTNKEKAAYMYKRPSCFYCIERDNRAEKEKSRKIGKECTELKLYLKPFQLFYQCIVSGEMDNGESDFAGRINIGLRIVDE